MRACQLEAVREQYSQASLVAVRPKVYRSRQVGTSCSLGSFFGLVCEAGSYSTLATVRKHVQVAYVAGLTLNPVR